MQRKPAEVEAPARTIPSRSDMLSVTPKAGSSTLSGKLTSVPTKVPVAAPMEAESIASPHRLA
eukprot:458005-Pleurochrysis_carterae.AAC.3